MKALKMVFVVLAMMLALGSFAYAAPAVDVAQAPTGWFVPTDAQKYDSHTYWRWFDQDWGWTHGMINTSSATTATLNISAFDVDAPSEVDNIYAYNGTAWILLGSLAGGDNIWAYTNFNLDSSWFAAIAAGLQVKIDIDTTHNYENWAVCLAKSSLSVDGGVIPDPTPGVPEPATMLLLGLGLAGLATLRKKF